MVVVVMWPGSGAHLAGRTTAGECCQDSKAQEGFSASRSGTTGGLCADHRPILRKKSSVSAVETSILSFYALDKQQTQGQNGTFTPLIRAIIGAEGR
jgi:hypothetical protein